MTEGGGIRHYNEFLLAIARAHDSARHRMTPTRAEVWDAAIRTCVAPPSRVASLMTLRSLAFEHCQLARAAAQGLSTGGAPDLHGAGDLWRWERFADEALDQLAAARLIGADAEAADG